MHPTWSKFLGHDLSTGLLLSHPYTSWQRSSDFNKYKLIDRLNTKRLKTRRLTAEEKLRFNTRIKLSLETLPLERWIVERTNLRKLSNISQELTTGSRNEFLESHRILLPCTFNSTQVYSCFTFSIEKKETFFFTK